MLRYLRHTTTYTISYHTTTHHTATQYLQSISCATEEECFLVPNEIALNNPLAALTARGVTTSCARETKLGCIWPLLMDPCRSRGESLHSWRGEDLVELLSLGVANARPLGMICVNVISELWFRWYLFLVGQTMKQYVIWFEDGNIRYDINCEKCMHTCVVIMGIRHQNSSCTIAIQAQCFRTLRRLSHNATH